MQVQRRQRWMLLHQQISTAYLTRLDNKATVLAPLSHTLLPVYLCLCYRRPQGWPPHHPRWPEGHGPDCRPRRVHTAQLWPVNQQQRSAVSSSGAAGVGCGDASAVAAAQAPVAAGAVSSAAVCSSALRTYRTACICWSVTDNNTGLLTVGVIAYKGVAGWLWQLACIAAVIVAQGAPCMNCISQLDWYSTSHLWSSLISNIPAAEQVAGAGGCS